MINEQELRKALSVLKGNDLYEIRIMRDDKKVLSGYFKDSDKTIQELKKQDLSKANVYITLNALLPACENRTQFEHFEMFSKASTSDADIMGFQWLFIDLDPKRPAGTSSSEKELAEAREVGNKVYSFMQTVGFNKPIVAESGNGIHLLYRIALKNSKENIELVRECLKTLDMFLSTENVKVDCSNFNPARICKLYGTCATKGRNSDERPHRMSRIISVPDEVKSTDRGYLTKLVDMQPKVDKAQKYNNYSPSEFNVEEWMGKYGINYRRSTYSEGTKYILDCCPFNSNHKGKDACIMKRNDGGLAFHCFHNECSDRGWKDVRLLFEPDAYEKKQKDYENRIYNHRNRDRKVEKKEIIPVEGNPVFYSPLDVFNLPKKDEEFIRTGIVDIDKKIRGLKKGYVSVISGLRASSKSTILSQISLNGIDEEQNVGIFSGELTARNFMRWMNLQAAGKGNVEPTQYEGYYNVRRDIQKKIAEWMDSHFWLYNNDYGNNFEAVMEQFEKAIDEHKLDLLILDNLMAFDIRSLSDNKWDAQTEFVLRLQKLAKSKNVHIIFVAHPRKALGFLRLDDISGTGDLANAVDNAFIVHRVNNDFKRLSKQMFGWNDETPLYHATNCVEIAKDRDGGICDCFVPLYYEIETKRLKNSISENIIYGWNKEEDGFLQLDMDDEVPFE